MGHLVSCRAPLLSVSGSVTPVAFKSVSPAGPSWVSALTCDISVVIPATTRGLLMIPVGYTDNSSRTTTGVALDPAGANTALTQVSGAAKSTVSASLNTAYGGVDYYYLKLVGVTPATYTVRITASGGTPVMVGTGQMFEYVDQTSPIGAVVSATGVSATPASGAISSNANNMLVGACMGYDGTSITSDDQVPADLNTQESLGFNGAGLSAVHLRATASHGLSWVCASGPQDATLQGWACCAIELVAG